MKRFVKNTASDGETLNNGNTPRTQSQSQQEGWDMQIKKFKTKIPNVAAESSVARQKVNPYQGS